jgi:WD40 repeat protein
VPAVKELQLRNATTGAPEGTLSTHPNWNWTGPCAFSPDGTLLAVSGGDPAALIVWEGPSAKPEGFAPGWTERYRFPVSAFALAFSPDSLFLALATDRDVRLVEAATGRDVLTLRGHTGDVQSVAWAPGGRFLASGGADQTVRVWDVETGREHRTFRGHTGTVLRVAYHPDGDRLVTGDSAGVLKVWDVGQDQRVRELPSPSRYGDLAFTADGRNIHAINVAGFRGWELATGRRTPGRPAPFAELKEYPLHSVALSADGRFGAGPDREDPSTIGIWNAETGERVRTLAGHRAGVRTLAFSPDGRRLASASGEMGMTEPRELFVWELPEPGRGDPSRIELACESPVQSLAFSTDGQRLVAGERGRQIPNEQPRTKWPWVDGCLSLWEVPSGKPEGVTTSGRFLRRWVAHPTTTQSVAFDPKGRWVASAGRAPDQAVRLWNADTGELLHDLRGPESLTCVTFHPDGTRLAAVGYEGWVHLWDPATGLDVMSLRGPGGRPTGSIVNNTWAVFSADGTRLAINSWTGSIHIWDARPLEGK